MKFLSYIFIIQVFLLTAAPAMAAEWNSFPGKKRHKTCCAAQTRDTPPQKGMDCSKGICNPFMSCCSCFALVVPAQAVAEPVASHLITFRSHADEAIADFHADAWHPPQLG